MMKVWTAFLVIGAAVSVVAWLVALCHENRLGAIGALMRQMRRTPKFGRVVLGILFVGMWLYGSVKQSGGVGSGGVGANLDSPAENAETQRVNGSDKNVANVEVLPVANVNTQLGNGEWGTGNVSDRIDKIDRIGDVENPDNPVNPVENTCSSSPISHYSSLITEGDCEAGFVLSGIGYGEVFDFALPDDAVVCDDWLRFGAHEDWFHLPLGWFSFPFGSNVVNALTVLSSGSLYPTITNASTFIAPLKASLGIVPMANWGRIDFGRVESVDRVEVGESNFNAEKAEPQEAQSCFWHCVTKTNTVVFTWHNVLLERDAGKPVSFQCEISHNGDMMFRYDLSNLTENPTTNVLVGLSNGRYERLYSALSNSITSLKWSHLDSNDYLIPDRDGDGISTADEIFIHRTDPGNADTDMDGLSDGEEILKGSHPLSQDTDGDLFPDGTDPRPSECDLWDDNDGDFLPDSWKEHWFGTNSISAADDTNCDGVPNIASLMIGMNPVCQSDDGFAVPCGSFAPEINAWEIIPTSFSSACPQSVTDLIVRTYPIARNSPWEQFFISARPDRAKGWAMSGMELLYGTDGEPVTNAVPASSSDSLRLDFGESMPQTVTVRLVTKGSHVSLSSPLYLLRWTPKVEFASSPFVHIVNSTNGHVYAAGKRDPATGLYSIPYSLDTGKYPHDGGMDSCTALDLSLPPVYGISVTNIPAQAFTATDPVLVDLPREGMNLSKRILCYSVSFENATAVDSGPRASKYDSPYPLDRRSLRVAYHEASDKESKSSVALVLKPSVPELSFRKAATKTVRSMPLARTGDEDDGHEFFPPFSGWPEVGGDPCTNDTYDVDFEYPENHDSTYPEEDEEDEDDDCECGCDGDSSLGSFRLRIPLGESAHNEISGFLWTSINGPAEVSPELFNVLSAPGITVMTNSDRSIEVVNTRLGGKSLSVTNIANGVDIPVWDADGKFEARWEVVNEDGNIDSFRVRKITVLGNATEDVTYRVWEEYSPEVFGDVPEDLPVVVWERVDNLRGLSKRRYELRDEYESDFVLKQYEETYLDGNLIRAVLTDYIKIGIGESACRRVGSVNGYDEYGWYGKTYTYWCDTDNKDRHGRLRSFCSDREPWYYCDYDSQGRETVRIEQLDGSAFAELQDISLDAPLDEYTSVKVTLTDYAPQDGDSAYRNDSCKPRSVKTYVRKNGKSPILVSQETYVYERDVDSDGIAVCRQIRRSGFGDAVRTVASVSYAEDSSVPKYLRGLPVSVVDDAGVLTETAYSLSNGCLIATSRPSFNGREKDTFTKTTTDAAYRLPLKEETCLTGSDVVIDWTSRTYDSQRRLRSVRYSDGTWETNAYSCCRLLWRQDREGRKTLRSAKTGNDHLYYAEEDVWLADISTNGQYRITQHFFDGLGRETNTVVCVGTVPGEAVESDFNRVEHVERVERKTEYPYGGSDYAVTTDERGKVVRRQENHYGTQEEVVEIAETNGVEVLRSATVKYRNGGSSMRREWLVGRGVPTAPQEYAWTEERRFTDYAADGKRIDYVVTESSDNGVVTNSVSTYDLLGRLVAQETALGTVTYHYDEASPRMTGQTTVAGDIARESAFIYDDHAEQVGVLRDGVTTRTDTTYEMDSSNIVWRVTAERTFGESTNACIITKERLTGLCNECRSSVLKSDLSGAWMRIDKSFDEALGLETEKTESSSAETVSAIKKNGLTIRTLTDSESAFNAYDALGRVVSTSRKAGEGDVRPYQSFDYAVSGDLLAAHTYTNIAENITESYAYDMLGNRVETTDSLGNTVFRSYDPFGNIISECGATYPVRYTYDTQNRRTSLSTTRDGETWDVTRWIYDAATGLCTSKIYADGSVTIYTYTPDGLLLRETKSDGVWKEYIYDEKRQVVGVVSSDGKQDAIIERDEFGRVVSESNIAASSLYFLDNQFGATNQMDNVDGVSASFVREFDQNGRLVHFGRVGGESVQYSYAAHGSLLSVSNNEVVVHCSFTDDLLDAGYKIDIQGGSDFVRESYRDNYCRDNILAVTNCYGSTVRGWSYSYDALQRPVLRNNDLFGYNCRGEVVFSRRGAEGAENNYLYDEIGNLNSYEIAGVVANSYSLNSRNQYLAIHENSASLWEIKPQYDADGNLTQIGEWSYAYDSANRLVSVASNCAPVASFAYDTQGRRVKKVAADGTHRYFYDGQLLVYEHITRPDNTVSEIDYVWGNDISGTRDSACGIGGLLYLKRDGEIYIPFFDAYGNVLGYTDAHGNVEAEYTYDPFGKIVGKSGAMSDDFAFRFSTKYYDVETDLYYYIYRYYMPHLMRWLTEDPIAEDGGLNLYGFCGNNPVCRYDKDGRAYFAVRGLGPIPTPLKWSDIMSGLRSAICPFASFSQRERDVLDNAADFNNIEILHEQLFFEDGGDIKSIGWGNENGGSYMYNENPNRYTKTDVGYDDCIMRLAVAEVSPTHYQLTWIGSKSKCNCQDYASALRAKYRELENNPEVKCRCKKGNFK